MKSDMHTVSILRERKKEKKWKEKNPDTEF